MRSMTVAVIDADDVVVAVLLAPPKGESFDECGRVLAEAIERSKREHPLGWKKTLGAKRGDFPTLTTGIQYNYSAAVSTVDVRPCRYTDFVPIAPAAEEPSPLS